MNNLITINPKQVEWLVTNQPKIDHIIDGTMYYAKNGEMNKLDIRYCLNNNWVYQLTPETYASLPQTFKDLC
jgi:hypothetical protein